jgi:haloalkane dehalogenase
MAHTLKQPSKFNLAGIKHIYPFTSHFIQRHGWNYHYLDEGCGPAVVMLHGNPTWSFYYRNLVKALAPEYRTIVPDHMGCGLSDVPPEKAYDYSLESRIEDLEVLLSHLNLAAPLTLVLHDWGGIIGMAYAVKYPQRISRLVILNTAAFLPPRGKQLPLRLKLIRDLPILAIPSVLGLNLFARGALWMATQKGLPADVRQGLIAPYNNWRNRLATLKFVQDIPLTPADASYRIVKAVEDNLDRLRHIPMQICWGQHDFVFDRDYFGEWRRRFPQARTQLYEDAGHYVLEDQPKQVVSDIKRFLQEAAADSF